MTDMRQAALQRRDDRAWATALAIDDFSGIAANRDWIGSIPADSNWRTVLRADAPGTIACTEKGELRLTWPTSASLVHLFTFLPLPAVAPGSALQVRIVLTSRSVADLLRVLVAVVLQHRRGDDFYNSLSIRDMRIVRTAEGGTQAIAEGVLEEMPASLDQFKLLFRLNPAAGELAVRSVEVFTRAVSADHPLTIGEQHAAPPSAAVLAPAALAATPLPTAIAVHHSLPRLIQTLPAPAIATADVALRDELAALRGDVARLATVLATRMPAGAADATVERLTAEVAALVRQHEEMRQALLEEVAGLAAENDRLRRDVDRLSAAEERQR
jgi:hypothetical protein